MPQELIGTVLVWLDYTSNLSHHAFCDEVVGFARIGEPSLRTYNKQVI